MVEAGTRSGKCGLVFALALSVVGLSSCASTRVEDTSVAPQAAPEREADEAEEWADLWEWFADQAVARDRELRSDPEWGLLLEVRLRWACVGLCTSNELSEIVLRRDGRSTYLGQPASRAHGRYVHDGSRSALPESRLGLAEERWLPFFGVAEYVTSARLRDLDDEYTSSTFDAVECQFTFVWERHTKRVREWADAGPLELWVLKSLLWRLGDSLRWQVEAG